MWLRFAEDVKMVIAGVCQELILTRLENDDVLWVTTTETSPEASVDIQKISWVMPYISVLDAARIDLLRIVNNNQQLKTYQRK